MDKNKNYSGLKKFCLAQGIDLFGVADIQEEKKDFQLSEKSLAKLDKAVCFGLRLMAMSFLLTFFFIIHALSAIS